jgi:hypothetical protein
MFGFGKAAKWNKEDAQIMLVSLILEAGTASDREKEYEARGKVFLLQEKMSWSNSETAERCIHAASMIKTSFDRNTYSSCKEVARGLYQTLKR